MKASTTPRARLLAASLFALSAVTGVAGVGFSLNTAGLAFDEVMFNAGQVILGIGYPAVGALVAARHPRNACGWILITVGLLQAISAAGYSFGVYVSQPGLTTPPGAHLLLWLSNWVWFPSLALLVTFLLLLFPDGRLPSPRWRHFARLVGAILGVGTAGVAYHALPLLQTLDPALEQPDWLVLVVLAGLVVGGTGSVTSLVVRYRRSAGVPRQQLKMLAVGGIATFGGVLLAFIPTPQALLMLPVVVFMLALPASIGLAIVRYRLFDIDRLISRTLSYLLLTGLLAGIYAAGVVLLHPAVSRFTGESQVAVALSTIAVAALFRPARRRIQGVVDRRFNRARYDAQRVVEQFSADLRSQVDLERLNNELLAVVGATVAPTRVALWLRGGDTGQP